MEKIELPDLESHTDVEIVKDNLLAAQAIYFAYQLEELRLFQVVERIVEMFQQRLLPLGRGRAGQILEQYWRAHRPMPESDRRNAYWRMFGVAPSGDAQAGEANSEFLSLWMRFVAARLFARIGGLHQSGTERLSAYFLPLTLRGVARSTVFAARRAGFRSRE